MPFAVVLADPPWSYRDKLAAMKDDVARSSDSHYRTMTVDEVNELGRRPVCGEHGVRCDCGRGKGGSPLTIAEYPIADDAILFLWVTNPMLLDGSGPRVCRAWGFEPKQLITWIKGRIAIERRGNDYSYDPNDYEGKLVLSCGLGHYTRGATEHLILATRGRATGLVKDHGVRNVLIDVETVDELDLPTGAIPGAFVAPTGAHSTKPNAAYDLIDQLLGADTPKLELFARRKWSDAYTTWRLEAPK